MEAEEENMRILCLKRLYLDSKDMVLKAVLPLLSHPLEITPFQAKVQTWWTKFSRTFQTIKYISKILANI